MNAIFETFKLRAEAVSAEVHHFPRKNEALDFILHYLHDAGISDAPQAHAVWASCPFLDGFDQKQLSSRMPGLTFDVTRGVSADAKVGISQLDWAIANTGTLVQDAAPVDQRLVSTLPLIHIALVRSDRLVPDLPAALTKIRPDQTNYISFITGPSRTADIERVLTIGVHGPEKLIIVFFDDVFFDEAPSTIRKCVN
ncbi:MAG: lactate utilization protein [Candidatus Sulfotelmatobacter sp.]